MLEPYATQLSVAALATLTIPALFARKKKRLRESVLTYQEQEFVCAVANAFFPSGGPIEKSGVDANVLEYFDRYMQNSEPLQKTLIHLLLAFTELSPLLFGPRFKRFTALSQEERIVFLHGAFTSKIYFRRVSFISLRAVMTMAYLADDTVADAMNMKANTDPFGVGDEILEVRPEGETA